jgi:hypothetical protein
MNANLPERFKHSAFRPNTDAALSPAADNGLNISLNLEIRNYVTQQENLVANSGKDSWTSHPEIPTNDELAPKEAQLFPTRLTSRTRAKRSIFSLITTYCE